MLNKILLMIGLFVASQSILAQGNFSYKRQLSYKQCENCSCKKSRSYKIISTNLSSFQRNCAQEDINADLTVKEMFQNGTSGGGLFAGFNLPQEGCGDDCPRHEFQNTSDDVETVYVDDCFTEAQKQKNNQEKINEQKNKEEEEARIASERIKLKEFLKKKDEEIDVLRKEAKNLYANNDLKACLIIQEKICIQSAELKSLYEKNNYNYHTSLLDFNNYTWYLILNKEYGKALNKLNEFFKMDFGKLTTEELEKFRQATYYQNIKVSTGEYIGMLLGVNFTHAILLSNKNESLYKALISRRDGWLITPEIILEEYKLLEDKGIEIPNGRNYKFFLKSNSKNPEDLRVTISTNSNVSFKNYFKNFKSNFEQELSRYRNQNRCEIKKMDENVFVIFYVCSNCSGSFSRNIYYYLDFNGNPIIVYDCPPGVSSKKEIKIVAKSKLIRDKDLGITPKKK
jgi:hypothetical protein